MCKMGRLFMFMLAMFVIINIAANIMAGATGFTRTALTADIDESETTIAVKSTTGFPDVGMIIIEDERIGYSDITATTFGGSLTQPLLRATGGTDNASHSKGAMVSTLSGAMMNTAADYYIAVLADASGLQAFVAKPVAFFQLLGSFIFLPLTFLGTDLQILTVFWGVFGAGLLFSVFVALAGGRRV